MLIYKELFWTTWLIVLLVKRIVPLSKILRLLLHSGALHTDKSASGLLSLGQCLLDRLLLDALDVEAAHVAGADMVRLDKVRELIREELVNNLVVGDGSAFYSQFESLELNLSPLQRFWNLGAVEPSVVLRTSCGCGALWVGLWGGRCGKLALSSDKQLLGAGMLESQFIELLSLRGKFLQHWRKSKVGQSSINFNPFKVSNRAAV